MKEWDLKNIMINKIMSLGFSRPESEELVKVSKNIEEDYKKLW